MPTFDDDFAAIRALETRLATVFGTGGTYASDFTTYGGVDVKLKTDEDTEPENVGRPLLLIEQESGERDENWSSAQGEYRRVTALITTYVSDGSGAQQGTANPVTADELLSKDLVKDVEDNYLTYFDLGLADVRITSQRLVKQDGATTRRIPHRVSFAYLKA
jgi:hypothetical protein